MYIKRLLAGFSASLLLSLGMPLTAIAATTTLAVTPLNSQGWVFNPDPRNATPYEFNQDKASIGDGSLYVKPIGTTPGQKFIAEKSLGTPVSDINSLAFDFMIAGNGNAASANQFYMNVYANFGESSPTKFFDCRYDVVATVGSTNVFTTVTFNPTQEYPVTKRNTSPHDCPPSPSGMQALSATGTAVIRAFSLNVGDTTDGDVGLAAYLDKVVVNTDTDITTYDFEPFVTLSDKEQCKNGGWARSDNPTYKNQGDCVSYYASKKKNNQSSQPNFAFGSVTLSGPTQQLNFSAIDKGASSADQGTVFYHNPGATVYSAPLTCVKVAGDTAYFAYVIPVGSPGAGTWVVWKVVDGITDTAGFTTAPGMESANLLCESGSITPTNYPITSGDIVVQ